MPVRESGHTDRVHRCHEVRVTLSAAQRAASLLRLCPSGQGLCELSPDAALYVPRSHEEHLTGSEEANAGQDVLQLQSLPGAGVDRRAEASDGGGSQGLEREEMAVNPSWPKAS